MTTFKHRKVQKKRKYGLYALLVGLIAAAILALSVFLLFHILVAVIPFFAVLALILFIVSLIKNRN